MDVRKLRRLRLARIDDDEGSIGVVGDCAQRDAGTGDAVRLPWVLADEQTDFAVLEVGARDAPHQTTADPKLACLFLRQGA